ncbi:MAG: PAS domain S-box protein, partial [Chitinophagaceae bacterium]
MQPSYNINILLVEDNPGDQFLLTELLKSSGFKEGNTSIAQSMKEALDVLEHNTIHIVLLDLTLPDSSGIETFLALEKYVQIVPVVILSGMSDMKIALDAINMGAQDYLLKGDFDEKLLAKTILYSIERSHSLRALKESNEKYDIISKATNDMIWDWDIVTGVVNRSKEGWKKILRVQHEDVSTTQRGWDDRVHPDDREQIANVQQMIMKGGRDFFEIECRVQRDDGTYAYVHDRGFVVRNTDGMPVKLMGATEDITERKEAELMLANSEKRFRALIENSSDGLIIIDASGTTLDISPSAQRILAYTKEQYMAINSFAPVHPIHKEFVSQTLNKLVRVENDSATIEYMYQKGDGTYTWIESTIHNQMHEPVVNAIVINFRDIAERKAVEEELKKLSHIARETNNAVVITDANGRIQWVNEAFTRITEFELHEVMGRKPGECLQGPETSPIAIRYMHIKLSNKRPFACDVINYTKSGQKYWIRIQCQPQLDAHDNLVGYFALTTNITSEKEADTNIKASEEKYRSLFDFNPNSIIIWDPVTFKVLEVNNKAAEEYGYNKEEFLKLTVLDLRAPTDYNRIRALAKAFLENHGLTYTATREHLTKTGEALPMNYVSRSIQYRGKIAILAMGNNMKEKLKLEKALEDERTKKQFEITEAVITAQENERKQIGEELHD